MLWRGPPQPNGRSLMRQYPSKDIMGDMSQEDSLRKYHSSQTMNGLRIRSPDRVWTACREVSLRSIKNSQQVPATGVASALRVGPFLSKEAVGASRQTGLTTVKAVTETSRPFAHTAGVMLKSSHVVDMTALKHMSAKDLKELGIPMGPRKKILLALQRHTK